MIQAAFFDLDGTITDPITHTIPESTVNALKLLKKNNISIYVSSGRSYNMLETMNGVNEISWDGYICNNGGMIYDANGKLLKSTYFTKEQVEQLINKCKVENLTLNLCSNNYSLAPLGVDNYMITAHQFFDEPLPRYIKPYANEDIYMALVYADMSYDFHSFETIEGLQAFPNRSTYADIVVKGISKAKGLQTIGDILHITKEEMIAFGDECNDLEMLQYAGTSVAMGNANTKVKEICSFVTDNVDADGIYEACQHFKLI